MNASAQRENDSEALWKAFSRQPQELSLAQARSLLTYLESISRLDESAAESILRSLTYGPEIREGLIREPHHEAPPNRRLELWKGRYGGILAAVLWSEGAYTPIHDHSHFALTRVVEGGVTSLGFLIKSDKLLQSLGRVHFEKNRIYHVPTGDTFIHAVANFGRKDAIELHYYASGTHPKPSHRYEPVDIFKNAANIRDGDLVEINRIVDPHQLDERFKV
ncbi:MAG: hypothetical protein AB7F75_04025 [Planctomycetota bacterium]